MHTGFLCVNHVKVFCSKPEIPALFRMRCLSIDLQFTCIQASLTVAPPKMCSAWWGCCGARSRCCHISARSARRKRFLLFRICQGSPNYRPPLFLACRSSIEGRPLTVSLWGRQWAACGQLLSAVLKPAESCFVLTLSSAEGQISRAVLSCFVLASDEMRVRKWHRQRGDVM